MITITRDVDLCNGCGTCVQVCPASVYVQNDKDSIPELANVEMCVSCGHYVAICPKDAITHSEFSDDSIKPVIDENVPSLESVIELLRTRRSIRVFRDRPVERQLIEQIIDAARFAPSSHNWQTTEYTVVQKKEILEELVQATCKYYEKFVRQLHNPFIRQLISMILRKQAKSLITGLLPSFEQLIVEVRNGRDRILRNAPVVIFFHADERLISADINTQLAIQNAALMAYAQGLGSFWTGYLVGAIQRDKSIRQLINLPKHHQIYAGLAVGYPQFKYKKWMEKKSPEITWI